MNQQLNPTLAGAIAKAERGIAFLRIPGATSDHIRSAMDHFKSAHKLAASHHIVLVELEDQLPEPGAPLFDGTGAPAPGVHVEKPAPITSDEAILQVTGEAYEGLEWKEKERCEEDLMFAARMHFRSRGIALEQWHEFSERLSNMRVRAWTWDWIVEQIRTSGDFEWPYVCAGEGCGEWEPKPQEGEEGPIECGQCRWKRQDAERRAKTKAEKKAVKATKKPAKVATPTDPDPELGGDE